MYMKNNMMRNLLTAAVVCGVFAFSGCSSKQSIKFNVHSEPEGAHMIYQSDDSPWIYLGVTPLDVVEVLSGDQLEDDATVTLKVMRCGYLEQAKEWTGEELQQENEEKGMIFWTPRLIKATP